jgi:serine/threonine-protein kinase
MNDNRGISGLDRLDKYQITGVIGKGAAGVVYEGFDATLQRKVAIKVVRPQGFDPEEASMKARFEREALAAAGLNHPNIVTIFDYGEFEKKPAIVMEYARGRTLKDCVDMGKPFEISEIVSIISQILDALSYCHKRNIIHRDIKPANIILSDDNLIKVTDFGVAHVESSELTQTGVIIGTPSYMSPEQFSGRKADGRSDLFSTGVILYELLAEERPFVGASITSIMHSVVNVQPRVPSKVNTRITTAFDSVIKKALAKDPDKRYQSAEEFAAALKQAFEKSAPKKAAGTSGSKNYKFVLAGVVIAAIVVILLSTNFIPYLKRVVTESKPPGPEPDVSEMILIPEGEFIMGSDKYTNERPQQTIYLDSYHIDRFLVANGDFSQFAEATGYQTDAEKAGYGSVRFGYRWKKVPAANWRRPDGVTSIEGKEDHPVTQVSFNDALAYCEWKGKDLPTEAQWEKAARGAEGNEYPWGNSEPDDTLANYDDIIGTTTAVDLYQKGQSVYGVYDMAGNVNQWCKDFYSTGERKSENPIGPAGGKEHVVKGGSFIEGVDNLRSAHRDRYKSNYSSYLFGFRCAK